MPFVYDDLAEICRDKENLIFWLREKGLLGDFSGPCLKCCKGHFTFRKNKSYSKDGVLWRCSNSRCTNKVSVR